MEWKNALSLCLISLCSAAIVVLIAQSLDSRAASRLEPQLGRIVQELEAIRLSASTAEAPATAAGAQALRDSLVVYYFHGTTRCPTCRTIESQAYETLRTDFAEQFHRGEIVWKTLNYEEPTGAELAARFDVQMPVVVLARLRQGQIADWNRLDQVWRLVGDKATFAEYVRAEIRQMLSGEGRGPHLAQPGYGPAMPLPSVETGDLPLPPLETSSLPLPANAAAMPLPQ